MYNQLLSIAIIAVSLIGVIFLFIRKTQADKITFLSGLAGFGLCLLFLAAVFFAGLLFLNLMDTLLSVAGGAGNITLKASLYPLILCFASIGVCVLFALLDKLVIKKMFGVKTSLPSYLLIFLVIGSVMNFVLFQASYIVLVPVLMISLAALIIGYVKNDFVRAGICALISALTFSLVLQAVIITASALAGFSLYAVYLLLFLSAIVLPLSLHSECHSVYFLRKVDK